MAVCIIFELDLTVTNAIATAPTSEPLAPPPKAPSRDPSPAAGTGAQEAESSSGPPAAARNAETSVQSDTAQNQTSTADPVESVERGSRHSQSGRERGASTGSKRPQNEKAARPGSSGRQAPTEQPRPKKKSGFLSFLNCCGKPDEGQEVGQQEPAQPAKPVASNQPSRAKPPSVKQNQASGNQNASAEDSKEVIDEKAALQRKNEQGAGAATTSDQSTSPQTEKATSDSTQADSPVPNPSIGIPPVHSNPETNPLASEKMVPEGAGSAPPHLNTNNLDSNAPATGANPHVNVQAPTPVVTQTTEVPNEDAMILDRTPEQAQRDNDIEMTDAGPSVPLSADEASEFSHEDAAARERRESSSHHADLPPPPPPVLAADASQQPSLVSTPDQSQKWLLPALRSEHRGRKCLVLDLDETLVHSSFKVRSLHHVD